MDFVVVLHYLSHYLFKSTVDACWGVEYYSVSRVCS